MTVALANAYGITFSEEARASWEAARAERYGPDPRAAAAVGASLAGLAARHGSSVVRRRDN